MVEYPSITSSMERSVSGLRENMDRIPHIVIGGNKTPEPEVRRVKKIKRVKKKVRKDPRDFKPQLYAPLPISSEDKLRKYILFGLTGLIIAVVAILIIVKLFKIIF